jgi:hypothetical protein
MLPFSETKVFYSGTESKVCNPRKDSANLRAIYGLHNAQPYPDEVQVNLQGWL